MSKEKLIPALRFPEFEDDGEWVETPIGEVFDSYSGGTPKTTEKEYYGGSIPFIRSAEIAKKSTELFLTEKGINNSSAKCVKKGDLLVALYGANSGDVAISKINGAINQAILCLCSDYSNSFTHQFLSFKKEWIVSRYIQGGQGNLSGDIVKSIELLFPKKKEQQKIASCLSSLDELITAHSDRLQALKDHKKGLMQNLFPQEGQKVPNYRFPEFKDDGEWEEKEVGKVFNVTRGHVLSMSLLQKNRTTESPYPVYSSQTVNSGLAGFYKDFLYENAITWTTNGANAGNVNYRNGKFYCTNVCGVLINSEGNANPCIAALINLVSKKHVSYVGNPKLMNAVMSKIIIPFPTLPEQQKIASCLSSLDELITAQTEKIEQLQQHKKGLMQGLFPKNNN